VDFDANSGLPYIALSSAVFKGAATGAPEDQFVGVVSVDLNIAALSDMLSKTDLYESGYAFVWDDNGMAVIHKGLKAGLERYDIAWVDATAGGKYELKQYWVDAQKIGIFDKGRVPGNWSYEFEGHVWYYTFMPIEGTPYMIALSVKYSEATKTADDMLAAMQGQVTSPSLSSLLLSLPLPSSLLFCLHLRSPSFSPALPPFPPLPHALVVSRVWAGHHGDDYHHSHARCGEYRPWILCGVVQQEPWCCHPASGGLRWQGTRRLHNVA
jgi:hypothetical protein